MWDPTTAAATATRFVYDGDRLVMETGDTGALRHFYVHGNAPDQPLIWWDFTGSNTRRFLHADQQGSIVAVTNGGTGAAVAINTYDPWGVPGANNGTVRFGYTGQAWIPELGMYYYKARFYYPALGRFLQTDPVGYKDQVNLYAYVGNDPLNHTDPNGEQAIQAAEAAVKACASQPTCVAAVARGAQAARAALTALAAAAGLKKDEQSLLFRAMTARDAASVAKGGGIIATSPKANITVDQHVAEGVKPSQFISTTKSVSTAESYAGPNGVAVIDSAKVPNQIDLSRGSFSLSLRGNLNAVRDSEVLVKGAIPHEAIIGVIPGRPKE